MPKRKGKVRIDLTPKQKAKVRAATGQDAEALELTAEELEERIVPSFVQGWPKKVAGPSLG